MYIMVYGTTMGFKFVFMKLHLNISIFLKFNNDIGAKYFIFSQNEKKMY